MICQRCGDTITHNNRFNNDYCNNCMGCDEHGNTYIIYGHHHDEMLIASDLVFTTPNLQNDLMMKNIKQAYERAQKIIAESGITYGTPQEFMKAEQDFQDVLGKLRLIRQFCPACGNCIPFQLNYCPNCIWQHTYK